MKEDEDENAMQLSYAYQYLLDTSIEVSLSSFDRMTSCERNSLRYAIEQVLEILEDIENEI
jgi:hypothetical protein